MKCEVDFWFVDKNPWEHQIDVVILNGWDLLCLGMPKFGIK